MRAAPESDSLKHEHPVSLERTSARDSAGNRDHVRRDGRGGAGGSESPAAGVPRILSSVVASQVGLHGRYGGVVPEIASRAHVRQILPMIDEALRRAGAHPG